MNGWTGDTSVARFWDMGLITGYVKASVRGFRAFRLPPKFSPCPIYIGTYGTLRQALEVVETACSRRNRWALS